MGANKVTHLSNRHERRARRTTSTAVDMAIAPTDPSSMEQTSMQGLTPSPTAANDLHGALLGQAVLLDWLGQAPISFHRAYVDIAGGVVPALWLSSAMARMVHAPRESFQGDTFVFAMSAQECEQETGISRGQQETCRRQLIAAGLVSEQSGQRKPIVYRLHLDAIARALIEQAEPLAQMLHLLQPQDAAMDSGFPALPAARQIAK
ncbi:hypothetical protein AVHY2522_23005 [Acidovorax sp. SUPP2522]|uniref:hypothetical protein n=1 Tax=unclassified Acidovorax TaxID=2684926 RepID=UPI00234B999D|nr:MULTISPECIES: hypothetical protein [unclassified Acidovorax]WCM95706.1 hypothetical protein M5C96_14575 [Acidovorax sp. GBBC 1281]GKT19578.1 hypothetical protein AVHY2522_23005 [Acidovorax sp. SUPP2522]